MKRFDHIINRYGTNSCKWDECKLKKGKELLQLSVADMDFKSPIEIIEKMKKIVNHGIFGYTMLPESYYDSIINWYIKRHNWNILREEILYCPRIGNAVSLIIQNMTQIEDEIILQTPAYPTLKDAIVKNGRKLIENPLILKNGKYEIDLDSLGNKISKKTKFFILCNPHNPTGRVFTIQELTEIVKFCKKNNILIISDEIHCDLVFKPNKHIPIGSVRGAEDISIVCSSITKTFNLPGIIASNIIIKQKSLREEVYSIFDKVVFHNPNIFAAGITEIAYNECEYWLDDVIEYIKINKEYVIKYVNKNLPKLKVIDSEATYLLWINFEEIGLSDDQFKALLENNVKVNVYMGKHFGAIGKGFIRVNLATPKSNIKKFLEALKNSLKNME